MVSNRLAAPPVTAETKASAVTVRLFAGAADVAGRRSFALAAAQPLTVGEAFRRLCGRFPGLRPMEGHLLFAANAEYAGTDFVLQPGDELAIIPPVSGGANP